MKTYQKNCPSKIPLINFIYITVKESFLLCMTEIGPTFSAIRKLNWIIKKNLLIVEKYASSSDIKVIFEKWIISSKKIYIVRKRILIYTTQSLKKKIMQFSHH